ncbi:MAG TPA: hypothetical protein VII38_22955 [Polyangia bacterium]|jgi:hypothetical protein
MRRLLPIVLAALFLPAVASARPERKHASVDRSSVAVRYPALDRLIRRFAAEARKKQLLAQR